MRDAASFSLRREAGEEMVYKPIIWYISKGWAALVAERYEARY
jgi:hypothetical protein